MHNIFIEKDVLVKEGVELMAKYLVIVESPAKSKTIEKYLGSDYAVTSSKGHIQEVMADMGLIWKIISNLCIKL